MSMNKFMHPRNPYFKNPPSFKQLAINYPEFRKHATTDLSGKVVIDFKDPAALRALAKTLLKKDFDLEVEIPLEKLIPTLPLRLNYLLWIEDLLQAINIKDPQIHGVDIGTGASCIYPLLAARRKGWHMLATEVDSESASLASKNVRVNNLEENITVQKVEATQLLVGVIALETAYHFCMCNPPFFSSECETDSMAKARSPSRTPPSGTSSASLGEVVVEGGEVVFVKRIIRDSLQLKEQIKVYTTMLGHKRSVGVILEELNKSGASSTTRTEFCQGNTTRWGVAWTFLPGARLPPPAHQLQPNKKLHLPMSYIVPKNTPGVEYTIESIEERVRQILGDLKMEIKPVKETKFLIAIQVTAFSNTWSKQRQKRRQEKLSKPAENGDEGPSYAKRPRLEENSKDKEESRQDGFLLQSQLVVRRAGEDVIVEMSWSAGSSGREAMHQVLQCLKNKLAAGAGPSQ